MLGRHLEVGAVVVQRFVVVERGRRRRRRPTVTTSRSDGTSVAHRERVLEQRRRR